MSKLFSWRVSMSAIDRVRSLTRRSRLLVATGAALSVAGIALAADVGSAESQVQALLKARLPKTAVSAIDCGKIAGLCEITAGENLFYVDTSARYLRSEEHTSELQSLMRISYAVFCLKNKIKKHKNTTTTKTIQSTTK